MTVYRTTEHTPSEGELVRWLEKDLCNWGRWGSEDERGTLNHIDVGCTRQALALVEEGLSVSCARTINYSQADPDRRRSIMHYMLSSGDRYRPGESEKRQVAVDFFGLVFHGHSVTHIDSLAHFFWDGKMYNGYPSTRVSVDKGAELCSVLSSKQGLTTRGILIDAPRLRSTSFLERGDGVGIEDFRKAESECGVVPGVGDIVLMRTGQLGQVEKSRAVVDPYVKGSSGPFPEILPLIHEAGVAAIGSDTGNDVQPSPYRMFSNPVHQVGIVGMGLWILDNVWLDDLADECVKRDRWEFALVVAPLAIPNATGSPVNPIALF